jgi:putative transposase
MAPISDKLLDELLRDYDKPEDLLGKEGIIAQLKKRLIERAMEAEMDEHLGYKKHEIKGRGS